MLLLAMVTGSHRVFAQSVTITLTPGWNWISVPLMDTLDFETAMGSFTPVVGDMVKSQWGNATYRGDGQWRGTISQFYPGYGYKYYSNRTMPVSVTFSAQQPAPQVIVTTAEPTDITANSATYGGNVASNDGNYVFVILRGICWSTNPNPTFNDNYIEAGNGLGGFTVAMTELAPNTTYYVRAFAVTAIGTFYGDEANLTTIPIRTIEATPNPIDGGTIIGVGDYEQNAVCNLTALSNEGFAFTNWTENDSVVSTDANYTFTVNVDRTLVANFTQLVSWPNGVLPGVFSISATQQIQFSQGNLQYTASTNNWRFAENQYDYIGSDNNNISSTYSGWIDLFGWGTSGHHDNSDIYNTNYYPYSTSASMVNRTFNYFGYGPSINMPSNNLNGTSANYDWGVYNSIINGGNTANNWRVLTQPEWDYLFNTRNTASGIRFAQAQVNGIDGVLLLPDNWNSDIYNLSNINGNEASFSNNVISTDDWTILENAGVVFLSAAGSRYEISVNGVGSIGNYWSASYISNNCVSASSLQFGNSYTNTNSSSDRCRGLSVRLVCNAE